jgi:hypothetical protein
MAVGSSSSEPAFRYLICVGFTGVVVTTTPNSARTNGRASGKRIEVRTSSGVAPMRRVLLICAVWTGSVLSVGMVVGACGTRQDAATPVGSVADASSRAVEQLNETTIPRGTTLAFALDDTVGSATSRVDERVHGHLTHPGVVNGASVVPAGSEVSGAVVDATPSHRVKGRAQVGIRFDTLRDAGETYSMVTPAIVRTAPSQMTTDAMTVVIPAAAGAVLGGVFAGGKGAMIGGAVGGGAGVGYAMSQRGADIVLGAGTALRVKLLQPITVRVEPPHEAQPLN